MAPGLRGHEHGVRRKPTGRAERARSSDPVLAVRGADGGEAGAGPADRPQQAVCVPHVRGVGEHGAGGGQLRQLERDAAAPAAGEPRVLQGPGRRLWRWGRRGGPVGAGGAGGAARQGLCLAWHMAGVNCTSSIATSE